MRVMRIFIIVVVVFSVAGCASLKKGKTTTESGAPTSSTGEWVEGRKVTSPSDLERVHFDFDSSVLRSEVREILKSNAQYLKDHPNFSIQIAGHCDERGSTEYNLALGERRGRSVKQYLVDLGVGADRMSVVSFGEEMPLDKDQTEEAYALNRRAEFSPLTR